MIKTLYFKFIFTVCVLLSGCADQLNITPEDAISTSQLTKGDVPTLENGIYEKLKDAFIPFFILDFDQYGENFQYPNGPAPMQSLTPQSGGLYGIWSNLYSVIFNANVLIEVASKYEGMEIDKALASGYFIRAYAYYNLVTRFGGVPLLAKNTTQPVQRADEVASWQFILNDLNNARKRATAISSPLFVSVQAVDALLARVHLARGDMSKAASFAQNVIKSGKFSFQADYQDIFLKDGGTELIFGLSNFEGDMEIWRAANATDFTPPGGGGLTPRQDLFDKLFEEGDARKQATFINHNGQLMLNKYSTNQTIPILVTRLSEMYLIRAEALGLSGGGLEVLNQLRKARKVSTLSIATEKEFQEAVALERRRELYSEGFLFFDLVRTGKAVEQLQFVNQDFQTRLPIPQKEIDLSKIQQNPGW